MHIRIFLNDDCEKASFLGCRLENQKNDCDKASFLGFLTLNENQCISIGDGKVMNKIITKLEG